MLCRVNSLGNLIANDPHSQILEHIIGCAQSDDAIVRCRIDSTMLAGAFRQSDEFLEIFHRFGLNSWIRVTGVGKYPALPTDKFGVERHVSLGLVDVAANQG